MVLNWNAKEGRKSWAVCLFNGRRNFTQQESVCRHRREGQRFPTVYLMNCCAWDGLTLCVLLQSCDCGSLLLWGGHY